MPKARTNIDKTKRKFFHCFCKKNVTKKAIKRIMTVGRTKYKKPVSNPNEILKAVNFLILSALKIPKIKKICKEIKGSGGISVYIEKK